MQNSYKIAIVYFILFSVLLLVSALMIFAVKVGFSPMDIFNYYAGNEDMFIQVKSFSGLLKVSYPHIFAIGLFSMVLLHFVYFTSFARNKLFRYLIIFTYISILLEFLSPFGIILGSSLFASVKLISFVFMFLLFFFIFWLLLHSILVQKSQNF